MSAVRNAYPDITPVKMPMDPQGRIWTRTHPKACATCGQVFYCWMPEGAAWETFQVDPEPPVSDRGFSTGLRGTCGDPKCREIEERHQLQRSPAYHGALQAHAVRRQQAEEKRGRTHHSRS